MAKSTRSWYLSVVHAFKLLPNFKCFYYIIISVIAYLTYKAPEEDLPADFKERNKTGGELTFTHDNLAMTPDNVNITGKETHL